MAKIILTDPGQKLDGSLTGKVFTALQKLQADDTSVGLHVEPIKNSADPRVRSVRINDSHRLLVFKISDQEEVKYIYAGAYQHDDAYDVAQNLRLDVNAVNGVLSFSRMPATDDVAAPTEVPASVKKAEEAAAQALAAAESDATLSEDAAAPAGKTRRVRDQSSPASDIAAAGHTAESLRESLGLDPELLARVFATSDGASFDKEADSGSPWELDALYGLAAGMSIEEIKGELGLDTSVAAEDANSDAMVNRALEQKATQLAFREVSDDELQSIIENGSFEAWTTFLHPTQRAVAYRSLSGSGRVSGGAGTGKTVVAIHRTKALVNGQIDGPTNGGDAPRVLLTTFTKALAGNLHDSLAHLYPDFPKAAHPGEPGVTVAGIDSTAVQIVNGANTAELAEAGTRVLGSPLPKSPKVLFSKQDRDMWSDAYERAPDAPHDVSGTIDFLQAEYETVVLAGGITSKGQYLKANRSGRGVALNRKARLSVWSVIETYIAMTVGAGMCTYATIGSLAAAALDVRAAASDGKRMFDHVVVDEAQDFHAGHWKLIRALVAEAPNDIFIAEDSHQRIYGHATRLSHFGIHIVGRAVRLKLNYRTTSQTLGFAMQILGNAEFLDTSGEADTIAGYHSARNGPQPLVAKATALAGELDVVAEQIKAWKSVDSDARIGILTYLKQDRDQIEDGLEDRGIDVASEGSAGVHVMTMHNSKGLEFQYVALVAVSQRLLPGKKSRTLADGDREASIQRDRSLLYVAASRARDELMVTHGNTPSEFLPDPAESGSAA